MARSGVVLAFARKLADDLEKDLTWVGASRGHWQATDGQLLSVIMARATGALEFLRQYTGESSSWTLRANAIYDSNGDRQSMESGARAVGDVLRAWVDQVEAGAAEIVGSRSWDEVGVVSTDLMEQVRRLLEDRDVHSAAPIFLCGAALEIALRATAEAKHLTLEVKPSISTWAGLLRRAELLTKQDVKDFEACGGIRNAAAHGEFGDLSPERAGLMEQQTNLLLRRLTDIQNVDFVE